MAEPLFMPEASIKHFFLIPRDTVTVEMLNEFANAFPTGEQL